METEDDNTLATMANRILINSQYGNTDWNQYSNYGEKLNTICREFHSTNMDIELPLNFKTVIMKLHPEIKDMVADYFETKQIYDPNTFNPVNHFQVAVRIFINENEIPKGNKDFYKNSLKDLFNMTYGSEMDFVTFIVTSIVIPPVKTNEEKFVELFGKKVSL
jgi:hypothetical protein